MSPHLRPHEIRQRGICARLGHQRKVDAPLVPLGLQLLFLQITNAAHDKGHARCQHTLAHRAPLPCPQIGANPQPHYEERGDATMRVDLLPRPCRIHRALAVKLGRVKFGGFEGTLLI